MKYVYLYKKTLYFDLLKKTKILKLLDILGTKYFNMIFKLFYDSIKIL